MANLQSIAHAETVIDEFKDSMHDRALVVGAGFAGATAARYLAKNSMDTSVLLVEAQKAPCQRIKCGEGVSERLFSDVELQPRDEWISTRISKIHMIYPNGKMAYYKASGYILDKRKTIQDLSKEAERVGAKLLTSTRVTDYDQYTKEVTLRVVEQNGRHKDFVVEPNIVIGCDGTNSTIGRRSGLLTEDEWRRCALALGYRVEDYEVKSDVIGSISTDTIYFVCPRNRNIGYGWIFPKGKDQINMGIGIPGYLRGEQPYKLLREFMTEHGISGNLVEWLSGALPSFGPPAKIFTDGVMLVGDAARQINPITFGGNRAAAIAGRIAGEIASEAFERKDTSEIFLKTYQDKCIRLGMYDPALYESTKFYFGDGSLETLNFIGDLFENSDLRSPVAKMRAVFRMLCKSERPLSFSDLSTLERAETLFLEIGW